MYRLIVPATTLIFSLIFSSQVSAYSAANGAASTILPKGDNNALAIELLSMGAKVNELEIAQLPPQKALTSTQRFASWMQSTKRA